MFRLPLVVVAVASTAYGFQDRREDTYAIYSLLFSEKWDSNSVDPIADTTVAPELTRRCVIPPADRRAKFEEIFADYAARKNERTRLTRELNIGRRYRYLDSAQVKEFMLAAGTPSSLISLGNVYWAHCIAVASR